jgi:hypothetical protein
MGYNEYKYWDTTVRSMLLGAVAVRGWGGYFDNVPLGTPLKANPTFETDLHLTWKERRTKRQNTNNEKGRFRWLDSEN